MAYPSDVGIINGGWMDSWNTAREPGFGMAYFDRTDLPFYFAMADAWTIGDQYFQSAQTATNPNRQFLFSGRNCDGNITPGDNATVPTHFHLDDDESENLQWETMAETLQDAGVTWRVLQVAYEMITSENLRNYPKRPRANQWRRRTTTSMTTRLNGSSPSSTRSRVLPCSTKV